MWLIGCEANDEPAVGQSKKVTQIGKTTALNNQSSVPSYLCKLKFLFTSTQSALCQFTFIGLDL